MSGVLRRTTRPGVGSSLARVKGPRGWRKFWRGCRDAAELTVWSGRTAWRIGSWGVRHPVLTVLAVAVVSTVARFGWRLAALGWAGGVGALMVGVFAWGWAYPDPYTRLVHLPVVAWWRRLWRYRRNWQPAVSTAGLALTKEGQESLPRLGRVRSTGYFDTVRATMLPGHTVQAWAKAGEQLAGTFGVQAVRAYPVPDRPRHVELRCRVIDPLRAVVPPLDVADEVDLSAVPVGLREDGRPLLLPANRHLLIAGESGAGKSSCIWALVRGVAPAIGAGTLKVVAIDPKATELAAGAPMWEGHCQTGKPEDAARFLEHVVTLMERRKVRLQKKGLRALTEFTVEDPAYVVIVDELAALTTWVADPKTRKRLGDAIGLVQSQGRALGFWLWGASQLPHKEVLGSARDLSQVRVAFRTAEDEHAEMILGQGARSRGALTDQIDPRTPGVCFLVADGQPEPVRGRVAYVDDAEIERIARSVAALRHPPLRAVPAA